MKIKCKLGLHDWGSWGLPYDCYSGVFQARLCKSCGLVTTRRATNGINGKAEQTIKSIGMRNDNL